MSQAYRLFGGGHIDRDRPMVFSFNKTEYDGYAGDTLASALLANGVHLVGRSFKYHRPRGILAAGVEEPNALIQLELGPYTQPNLRATQIELYPGLVGTSQNCWPGVRVDVGAVNNVFSRFIPAGFYYKTFMRPKKAWLAYEHIIRRAAGLGKAPTSPDPDYYDKRHVHCEVLVVGAGPAGLIAAHRASQSGARVILVDEQAMIGGSLLSNEEAFADIAASEWVNNMRERLIADENVTLLSRTTLTGFYDHKYLVALQRVNDHLSPGSYREEVRQRLWKIRTKQVIVATGAHERPLVFRNNDRPGVMLASAGNEYLNRYAVKLGNKGVIFTNNDSVYPTAIAFADAGIDITLVDVRKPENLSDDVSAYREALDKRGVRQMYGQSVVNVKGGQRVNAVSVAAYNEDNNNASGESELVECDHVLMSGGFSPVVHLLSQAKGELRYDKSKACIVPHRLPSGVRCVGAANGTFDLPTILQEADTAARSAVSEIGFKSNGGIELPKTKNTTSLNVIPVWKVPVPEGKKFNKSFVDYQNDVTAADLRLALSEGYTSIEHIKRYTTTGMGTDQGKTGNVNAIGIISKEYGVDIDDIGVTTFRPPYSPLTFGALAGRDIGDLMDPVRHSAMYNWHVNQGAKFEDVGQWKRPWYYPKTGETMQQAVDRECLAARNAVAILDASTLGKIEIVGPDSAELLNRIYINGWKSLQPGRARYGLMCTEDGMVFDDGVTICLEQNRYLMHTTSGNAARVLAWLEEWLQTEWPELKVYCTSLTEQWSCASICGPNTRALLQELTDDISLGNDEFPFMSVKHGHVAGIPARVARISFTGELSYEINVASHYGLALWNQLMHSGEKYGITPYGTESMHVLRAEKGFIIAGQETDGTVSPHDLGMGRMASSLKDFIGKRSLSRPHMELPDRKQLVGLLTDDPVKVLPEGGQIVEELKDKPPMKMIGHVTSSYYSTNLGRSIALALVRGGREKHHQKVYIALKNGSVSAEITAPSFFDASGERMHG